jgi:diguanylate cyclase (GGDEF)-like protein
VVAFIDLDDFKGVNDTLGHARGDHLLTLVGERLRAVVRPADTVARFGGDEFALLIEELESDDEALAVAERAVRSLEPPFELAGQSVRISASVGVSVRSLASVDVDELVRRADAAMYAAKRSGKGRAVLFDANAPDKFVGRSGA